MPNQINKNGIKIPIAAASSMLREGLKPSLFVFVFCFCFGSMVSNWTTNNQLASSTALCKKWRETDLHKKVTTAPTTQGNA
jgi:hypothetical protein